MKRYEAEFTCGYKTEEIYADSMTSAMKKANLMHKADCGNPYCWAESILLLED